MSFSSVTVSFLSVTAGSMLPIRLDPEFLLLSFRKVC